jgi:hypothetical protein
MTQIESGNSRNEEAERDARLDRWLTALHKIDDPNLSLLKYVLEKSWRNYVQEHAFSLARDHAFRTIAPPVPREEPRVDIIRLRSTSGKKWSYLEPVFRNSGFTLIRDTNARDEDHIHKVVRDLLDEVGRLYPLKVATMKQAFDILDTPVLTLDTVTYSGDEPLEKAKSRDHSIEMITRIAGTPVSTETGWVLGMQLKSGSFVELRNTTRISYTVKPLSGEEILSHVDSCPNLFSIPVGIDLSEAHLRAQFIDLSKPVYFSRKNHLAQEDGLNLRGDDLLSSVFDPVFSGVPVHGITALLPWVNDIYVGADAGI